jgi:hypothetical protein
MLLDAAVPLSGVPMNPFLIRLLAAAALAALTEVLKEVTQD